MTGDSSDAEVAAVFGGNKFQSLDLFLKKTKQKTGHRGVPLLEIDFVVEKGNYCKPHVLLWKCLHAAVVN